MRAPILLVAILLILAAGGVFFYLGSERAPGEGALTPGGGATAIAPGAPTPADQEVELSELARPQEGPKEAARTLVEQAQPAASVETKVERARITGRLVNESGRAIAGAAVEAKRDRGFGGMFDLSGESAPKGESLCATSGTDGRFELSCDWNGALVLKVLADGYAPFERGTTATPGGTSSLGELTLEAGVVLAGQVLDHRGRPLPQAKVYRPARQTAGGGLVVVRSGSRGELVSETDAQGRFEVANQWVGEWKLVVAHEDHPDEVVSGELAHAGERDETLLVRMREGYEILGHVSGMPAGAELNVSARPSERKAGGLAMIDLDLPGRSSRSADVQADGSFALRGLEQGKSYELKAREQDAARVFGRSTRSSTVVAKAGEVGVELEYSVGTTLVFQVVDSVSGKPLTEFQVAAGIDWPMPLTDEDGKPQRLHEDGWVRFEGLRPRDKGEHASLQVTATGYEDYELKDIALPIGEEVPLDVVRMRPIPVVRVTVLDNKSGQPIAGARVTLSKAPDTSSGPVSMRRSISIGQAEDVDSMSIGGEDSNSGKTDASGVCVLSSMPGADVTISARDSEHAPVSSRRMTLPLVGDVAQELRMKLGGRVEVTVLDSLGEPLAGQKVKHRAPQAEGAENVVAFGGAMAGKRTDSAGKVLFEQLEDGLHGFKLSDEKDTPGLMVFESASIAGGEPDRSWEEIGVVDGELSELTLVAASRGELAGIITEAGQPLVGATIRLDEQGKKSPFPGMMMMGGGLTAKTDGKGAYVFEDIKAADYELSISHSARAMDAGYLVEVPEGGTEFDVDLAVTIVEGRITDEEGKPLAGIVVKPERVAAETGGPHRQMRMVMVTSSGDGEETVISDGSAPSTEARTDEDGFYQLRGVEADVDLQVKASGGDFEPTSSEVLRVPAGSVEGGVDLVLKQAGKLAVVVSASDGTPAANVMVSATFTGESEERVEPKFEFIQRGGEATLSGLKPGAWRVTLRKIGEEEGEQNQDVEVVAAQTTDVSFRMP